MGLASATIGVVLSITNACQSPTTTHQPELIVQSGINCFEEDVVLPLACNVGPQGEPLLGQCPAEDDAIDGTEGPECYWYEPDGSGVMYNDGSGYIAPKSR
jgi:hypothetical protein